MFYFLRVLFRLFSGEKRTKPRLKRSMWRSLLTLSLLLFEVCTHMHALIACWCVTMWSRGGSADVLCSTVACCLERSRRFILVVV